MYKNNFLFFFLLISLYEIISTSYVTIPFQIYKEDDPSEYSSLEDFINYNSDLQFYGEISIGESTNPIPILFSFDNFGYYLISKGTNVGNLNRVYDPFSSYSFKYNPNNTVYFGKYGKSHYANDTFAFNKDSLKCRNIKFIYCGEDHNKMNSYMIIGLRLLGDLIRDSELNLVKQLRQYKYTETYDWSIHFDENDKNKGVLLIGTEAHKYRPDKFNQSFYFNSVTLSKELFDVWNLRFDKIYFMNNKEEMQVDDLLTFTLKHQSNLISGSKAYEKLLKKYFFDDLIAQGKCQMEKTKVEERIYTCKNTEKIKAELKEKFPPLKMENKAYLKTFELTYDDLFLEKRDKIYFLVYFGYYMGFTWEVGLPFLQKYFLNYNYDTKLISYYNNDLPKFISEEKKNSPSIGAGKIFLIIFLIIVISLLGFYLGRKYILMRRKEKIRAEELESEFSKQINDSDNEYQPSKDEKNISKYFLI